MSRRDALRYATAASALAGLGAATGAHAPGGVCRRCHGDRLRHPPDPGSGHPRRRSLRGDQLVSTSAGLVVRRQTDHAAVRKVAQRFRLVIVSNYQFGKPEGTAPSDFTRGYAGGVADARTAWQLHTAAGGGQIRPFLQRRRRYRPRDVEQRRAAVVSRNRFGDRSAAHRDLRGPQGVPVGCGRRSDREIGFARPRVGLANRSWSGGQISPPQSSTSASLPPRPIPGRWSAGSRSTSTTCWPRIAASGTSIRDGVSVRCLRTALDRTGALFRRNVVPLNICRESITQVAGLKPEVLESVSRACRIGPSDSRRCMP